MRAFYLVANFDHQDVESETLSFVKLIKNSIKTQNAELKKQMTESFKEEMRNTESRLEGRISSLREDIKADLNELKRIILTK